MSPALKTALFYKSYPDDSVICGLCPHRCRLASGETGICRTRRNHRGALVVLTHGRLVAGSDDPIEKKPLFHFHPGSRTFSVATNGCNLSCPFCQNHHLSFGPTESGSGNAIPPGAVVNAAQSAGCRSIAFTYSEPILMLEYVLEIAPLAEEADIELVLVTNGQATRIATDRLTTAIHAANIDLKCFSKTSYRDILGGRLSATLETLETWAAAGIWVEATTLIIPGFNDGDDELRDTARFLFSVNPAIPWHVSRFHPTHKWRDRSATPTDTLRRAREIGLAEGLKFVYTGNVPGDDGEKTRCPQCDSIAIDRVGYRIIGIGVQNGRCQTCGEPIAGRGLP